MLLSECLTHKLLNSFTLAHRVDPLRKAIRVTDQESAVACTSTWVIHIDLRNHGAVLGEQRYQRGVIVTSTDVNHESYIIADSRGITTVQRLVTFEQVCRFMARGAAQGREIGCTNLGYAIISADGSIGVWEVERGEFLHSFGDGLVDDNAIIADNQYVTAYSGNATLHLWDFRSR